MPELAGAQLSKEVPPGVQRQYEDYIAIPGYMAIMWTHGSTCHAT